MYYNMHYKADALKHFYYALYVKASSVTYISLPTYVYFNVNSHFKQLNNTFAKVKGKKAYSLEIIPNHVISCYING